MEDYEDRHNQILVVPYVDVKFCEDMGKGKRNKRQTEFYKNEQETAFGATMVKAGHNSNMKPCKTSN